MPRSLDVVLSMLRRSIRPSPAVVRDVGALVR